MKDFLQGSALVEWHLFSNHYPPPPRAMLIPVWSAIEAIREGMPERSIRLPEGITFRGRSWVSASDVAECFHLWELLEDSPDNSV
jgi:hypothetical protein